MLPFSLPPGTTPSSSRPSTAPPPTAPLRNTPTASTPPYGTLRVWDIREPLSTVVFPPHEFKVLITCNWNKCDNCIIATASVDKSIKVWNVRSFRFSIAVMNGHGYEVRKVKFSPQVNLMVFCSYDMTVCVWDFMVEDALVSWYDHHIEFVVGVDMSVLVEGLMTSTDWDELVYIWQHGTDKFLLAQNKA